MARKLSSWKSMLGWFIARNTLSGMLVGPGLAKNWRPVCFLMRHSHSVVRFRPRSAVIWQTLAMAARCQGSGEGKSEKIYVGVGGWTYEPWRGTFYPDNLPQKRELEYAASRLTSIEINGTYYGSQKPESFAKWHRRDAGRLRVLGQGATLRHQPPRARRCRRGDRAILREWRDGAQGQARTDQLAAHAHQEIRSGGLWRRS